MSKNFIGLDTEKTQSLANALNDLLSNYQIFYMNVRGYHWNIKEIGRASCRERV